jgi:formiminoglutamase
MFKKADPQLFFKSPKSQDKRLGEWAQSSDLAFFKESAKDIQLQNKNVLIAGYPDDEGIKNNLGRLGARLAPHKIREYFYKMTPPFYFDLDFEKPENNSYALFDIGDLDPSLATLKDRHEFAKSFALQAFQKDMQWIALGGGHDYAYPDLSAFIQSCSLSDKQKERPLIINFDAHLDVRSTQNGINSGTAFFRILEEFKDIDLIQIGIQAQCNSRIHYKYAEERGVTILNYDDFRQSSEDLTSFCLKRLGPQMTKKRKCFLSVDMDGFSNSYAPGCSQSFATGLHPDEFFQFLSVLGQRLDLRGLGIYETSPPFDVDDRTSKLAALIMHKYIFAI